MQKPSKKPSGLMNRFSLRWVNFLVLTLAGTINAFGVTLFLFPVKLYDSGISGVSMLLDQVTPAALTLSLFLLILNVPIFAMAIRSQGASFTIYSVYTVAIYSLVSWLIVNVLNIDVSTVSPLAESDLLLCAIFGGAVSGIGSGLTIRFGGAIDGIDVVSVVFSKKLGVSIGQFVLTFNTILYIICGIVIKSWILPLYSIVTYYVGSQTVDFVVEGISRCKCAMIITDKADEISDALSKSFKATGTIVNAIGGYSREEKQIIYFVVNPLQINRLKTTVYGIDPKAFVTMQEIAEVVERPKLQLPHRKK